MKKQSAASTKAFERACATYAHPGMVEYAYFDGKVLKQACGLWHPFASDLDAKHFACLCLKEEAAQLEGDLFARDACRVEIKALMDKGKAFHSEQVAAAFRAAKTVVP